MWLGLSSEGQRQHHHYNALKQPVHGFFFNHNRFLTVTTS